jgi:hypothetical protein
MPSNDFFNQKIPIIVLIYIWYYRVFGITFGGLVIKNGKCFVNKKLKIFSNFLTIVLMIGFIVLSKTVVHLKAIDQLYNSGFTVVYYLMNVSREFRNILVIINLFYYQFKGFHLFEILITYQMKRQVHQILILILFSIHLLITMVFTLIYLFSLKVNVIYMNAMLSAVLTIYYFIALSAIHLINFGKKFNFS